MDTHLLLWATEKSARLSTVALKLIANTENQLIFSAASIWEIAIKYRGGSGRLQAAPAVVRRALLDNDYSELPVTGQHAVAVGDLPQLHKDPFDRIMIAQAMVEGITLLTSDAVIAQYPGPIRRV